MIDYILDKIKKAELKENPFEYKFINNIFPNKYFEELLKNSSLTSVLIEINANREEDKEIIDIMKFHGFNYDIN